MKSLNAANIKLPHVNSFFKITIAALAICGVLMGASRITSIPVYSQQGSRGTEVEEIQRVLKEWGLFRGEITGYFGTATESEWLMRSLSA